MSIVVSSFFDNLYEFRLYDTGCYADEPIYLYYDTFLSLTLYLDQVSFYSVECATDDANAFAMYAIQFFRTEILHILFDLPGNPHKGYHLLVRNGDNVAFAVTDGGHELQIGVA